MVPTKGLTKQGVRWGWLGAVLCFGVTATAGAAAKPQKPVPVAVISLAELGYQPTAARFALEGMSLTTVDFADPHHLLVTFIARRLLTRIAGDPEDDDDHVVDAVLVELPSGKVAGKTTWRTHDNGRYLWSMGGGRFVLRRRNDLETFAPVANLAAGEPFRMFPLVSLKRQVAGIRMSADGDVMLLETIPAKEVKKGEAKVTAGTAPATAAVLADAAREQARMKRVELEFLELAAQSAGGPVLARVRGVSLARTAVDVPMTSGGYLEALNEGRNRWGFDFVGFDGKTRQLGGLETTCRPRPQFVSSVEFVVFGCRGSSEKWEMAGMDLRGQVMWVNSLGDNNAFRSLRAAPAAGRVALSRAYATTVLADQVEFSPEQLTGQDVRVMQVETGGELLRVEASPIERSGENYAIAQDGMSVAVIHDGHVEVYALPKMSGKEEKERERLLAAAPAAWGGAAGARTVTMPAVRAVEDAAADKVAGPAPAPANAANGVVAPAAGTVPEKKVEAVPAAAAPAPVPAAAAAVKSETKEPESAPRKPPSLYAPDEKSPEKKDAPK